MILLKEWRINIIDVQLIILQACVVWDNLQILSMSAINNVGKQDHFWKAQLKGYFFTLHHSLNTQTRI